MRPPFILHSLCCAGIFVGLANAFPAFMPPRQSQPASVRHVSSSARHVPSKPTASVARTRAAMRARTLPLRLASNSNDGSDEAEADANSEAADEEESIDLAADGRLARVRLPRATTSSGGPTCPSASSTSGLWSRPVRLIYRARWPSAISCANCARCWRMARTARR